jgi:alginate production protein
LTESIGSWLELAYAGGEDGSNKVRGFGFDLGSTYEFDLSLEPSITLGYAFGTGDGDPDDDVDNSFRQTGLQNNEGSFNGVPDFQYYGELLDPELSNLSIFTAGTGINLTEESSIDLVYHYYLQHKASDSLRDAGIDADPDGQSKRLGSEIDLIIGYEGTKGLELALKLGYFIPGEAFPSESENGFLTRLEIQYEF